MSLSVSHSTLRRVRALGLWLVLGMACAPASALGCQSKQCQSSVVFLTETSYPGVQVDSHGDVIGPTIDLMNILAERVGKERVFYLMPWARAMQRAQHTPRSILFETVRNTEREPLFKWVGPIMYFDMQLYGPPKLKGMNAEQISKNYVACGYRGASYLPILATLGFSEDTNLVLMKTQTDCLDMLRLGRADVTPMNGFRRGDMYEEPQLRLVPLIALNEVALYMAFSLDFSDSEIALWQQQLEQLYRDGTLRRFYQSNYPARVIEKLEQLAGKLPNTAS